MIDTVIGIFNVWPWTVPAGTEFFWTFLFGGSVVVALTALSLWLVGMLLDRGVAARFTSGAEAHQGGVAVAATTTAALLPERLPGTDGALLVAWLRGGTTRLAEAYLAAGGAAAWWTVSNDTFRLSGPAVTPSLRETPALSSFARALGRSAFTAGDLVAASRTAADEAGPRLREQLIDLGLMRGQVERLTLMAVGAVGGGLLVVTALARAIVREHLTGRAPPFPVYLTVATIVLVGVTGVITARSLGRTGHGDRHLRWLTRATASLRRSVKNGSSSDVRDTVLTCALEGLAAVGAIAGLEQMRTILAPPRQQVHGTSSDSGFFSGSSSDGGSSSGGSSCGGGGGCGGGCGGGGGCS